MSEQGSINTGGLGAFGVLAIVFTIFKLLGKISWSWWVVLLPLWGPIVFWLGFALIVVILAFAVAALS